MGPTSPFSLAPACAVCQIRAQIKRCNAISRHGAASSRQTDVVKSQPSVLNAHSGCFKVPATINNCPDIYPAVGADERRDPERLNHLKTVPFEDGGGHWPMGPFTGDSPPLKLAASDEAAWSGLALDGEDSSRDRR
jgi:hypothetical protein